MAVKIGSARIDENGRAMGGRAGDQTGREVSAQSWYRHTKGWRVLRAKDAEAAEKIAQAMQWACDSPLIGYDQGQRETLRKAVTPLGWDIRRLTAAVETDCSALVRVCCGWAFQRDLGAAVGYFNTTTMCKALLDTGLFIELTGEKYAERSDYLRRGDILCTRAQGHTVVVLSDGAKAGSDAQAQTSAQKLGDRVLAKGCVGEDVRQLQQTLLNLGYKLPRYGADGDFGSETAEAVRSFQQDHGLVADGTAGATFIRALTSAQAVAARIVRGTGANVNIRTAPELSARVLGVVHAGARLVYQGKDRTDPSGRVWHLVEYKSQNGWISGRLSEVE